MALRLSRNTVFVSACFVFPFPDSSLSSVIVPLPWLHLFPFGKKKKSLASSCAVFIPLPTRFLRNVYIHRSVSLVPSFCRMRCVFLPYRSIVVIGNLKICHVRLMANFPCLSWLVLFHRSIFFCMWEKKRRVFLSIGLSSSAATVSVLYQTRSSIV